MFEASDVLFFGLSKSATDYQTFFETLIHSRSR